MKVYLYIISILLASNVVFSQQLLQQFKASQGMQTAINLAKDSGMVKPVMVFVGTMTGMLPTGTMNLTLDFDENKGTSTVWVYVIKDLNNPNDIRVIAVFRMLLFFPIQLPSELVNGLPIEPDTQLPDKWIDSDELMSILKNYSDYSDFVKTYNGSDLIMLGLGINKINPLLKNDEPYWSGIFRGISDTTATISCFVHATDASTICLKFVSVDYVKDIENEFEIFPNPAKDIVYIIGATFKENFDVTLYDELGRVLKVFPSYELKLEGQIISVPLANFRPGIYFIRYSSYNRNIIKPVIIEQ